MKKTKVKNVKTNVVYEIPEELVDDYIGTGDYIIIKDSNKIQINKDIKEPLNMNIKQNINVRDRD